MSAEAQGSMFDAWAEDDVAPDAGSLEMWTSREVRYSILNTSRPVFDAQERVIVDIVTNRPVLLVVDRHVERLHGPSIRSYVREHLNVQGTVLIDGDETRKTWQQAELICNTAMEYGLGREGIIIGIGGGVVLDVSGFAAAIFRRGIGYLRIPTTLIGQVDVAIGVKQGVNVGGFKNVLGSFYPPLANINDRSLLDTLPASQIAAGFAEIIKMAMIADPLLFDLVDLHGADLLASRFQQPAVAARSIMRRAQTSMLRELKGNLFETNLQRLVDFGHTFSVAIETDSGYRVPHGHAVGFDMLISTCLSMGRDLCTQDLLKRMLAVFRSVELPVSQHVCSAERLYESLACVRAHRGGDLNLVIPRAIGQPEFVQDVSVGELTHALAVLADADSCHDRPRL